MDKLENVRWGFIGCGEVTEKKSGPAFNMVDGSKVVAVMSRDEEKVKSYAKSSTGAGAGSPGSPNSSW